MPVLPKSSLPAYQHHHDALAPDSQGQMPHNYSPLICQGHGKFNPFKIQLCHPLSISSPSKNEPWLSPAHLTFLTALSSDTFFFSTKPQPKSLERRGLPVPHCHSQATSVSLPPAPAKSLFAILFSLPFLSPCCHSPTSSPSLSCMNTLTPRLQFPSPPHPYSVIILWGLYLSHDPSSCCPTS